MVVIQIESDKNDSQLRAQPSDIVVAVFSMIYFAMIFQPLYHTISMKE